MLSEKFLKEGHTLTVKMIDQYQIHFDTGFAFSV